MGLYYSSIDPPYRLYPSFFCSIPVFHHRSITLIATDTLLLMHLFPPPGFKEIIDVNATMLKERKVKCVFLAGKQLLSVQSYNFAAAFREIGLHAAVEGERRGLAPTQTPPPGAPLDPHSHPYIRTATPTSCRQAQTCLVGTARS